MNAICGYTVVSYEDSMPVDWQTKLDLLPFGYCWAVHDKDLFDDGSPKKTHVHFCFQGKITKKQKQYIHEALGINYGENIRNFSAFYDYLTHKNHSSKFHYDEAIIQYGVKWEQELFESQYRPKIDYTAQLITFIDNNSIYEYSSLIKSLFELLSDDEILLNEMLKEAKKYWVIRYIDSKRHLNNAN